MASSTFNVVQVLEEIAQYERDAAEALERANQKVAFAICSKDIPDVEESLLRDAEDKRKTADSLLRCARYLRKSFFRDAVETLYTFFLVDCLVCLPMVCLSL